MGKFFADKTEEGIKLVWSSYDRNQIARGFQLLLESVKEGDGDACCFAARCYMGPQYVWQFSGIQEDDDQYSVLLKESIKRGSACGVLIAMRCGELTPDVQQSMPFQSLKEAWDIVLEKAEGGHPFCQYMIANSYFWGDIFDVEGTDPHTLYKSGEEMDAALSQKAIPWYIKSMDGGVFMGLGNLAKIYRGKNGLPADMNKLTEMYRTYANRGNPLAESDYAATLYDAEKYEEALRYYLSAAQHGQISAWYDVGFQYERGEGVAADPKKAAEYYQIGADQGWAACQNGLGNLYFRGLGVPQDYGKAAHYLGAAASQEYKYAYPQLGHCYLKGLGVQKDPVQARKLFEGTDSNITGYSIVLNGLGEIYADGLGVPEDIKKGVEYFEQAAAKNNADAKLNLSRFKKSLFGKWSRR